VPASLYVVDGLFSWCRFSSALSGCHGNFQSLRSGFSRLGKALRTPDQLCELLPSLPTARRLQSRTAGLSAPTPSRRTAMHAMFTVRAPPGAGLFPLPQMGATLGELGINHSEGRPPPSLVLDRLPFSFIPLPPLGSNDVEADGDQHCLFMSPIFRRVFPTKLWDSLCSPMRPPRSKNLALRLAACGGRPSPFLLPFKTFIRKK